MLGIPLDVVADGFEAGLETGPRAHHRVRQWTQSGQPLARDDHVEASQVGLAFAFRALAQELAALLFGAFLLRLDKQPRVVNQALAHGVACALVMLEPAAQRARGQRRLLEGL